MSLRIEDYALIGNLRTAALVGRDGSINWLCVPRFDSPACFAALLGDASDGRWLIAPEGEIKATRRSYRAETLSLETVFERADGVAIVTDFMPVREQREQNGRVDVIRLIEGREGSVPIRMELAARFGYGAIVPWLRHTEGMYAVVGSDALILRTPVKVYGEDLKTVARFAVSKGDTVPFTLIHFQSNAALPEPEDPLKLRDANDSWWKRWTRRCDYDGPYRQTVLRSLITLKALNYWPTGAIVAAPTTSLPEQLGGSLNWDYRYCWLRDSTLALCALLVSGYEEEASAWRAWLLRAAGRDCKPQIVYGLHGEKGLEEIELAHLSGYENSRPVRVGNAAHEQFQLDVYGEIMNALHVAHVHGIKINDDAWRLQCALLDFLENAWRQPDSGFWEIRGATRHYTESKAAAWLAFDRAIKLVERHGFEGPSEKWRALRQQIHEDVCRHGFDRKRGSFVQYYGDSQLDAALLRLPLIGFLPVQDPRIVGTVAAIQRELMEGGLVKRYRNATGCHEGAFLACTCWLVDCLAAMGRRDEALRIYDGLIGLCNDVGLLAEEYDPANGRMEGNFPQAITHVALINSAYNLFHPNKPRRLASVE